MRPTVVVTDHHSTRPLEAGARGVLERLGGRAAGRVAELGLVLPGSAWSQCPEVEVALVDDEDSARVHSDFLGIPGPTDVITFDHGEIVIGLGVARRQAAEYGEPELRELLRYLVHGLLHLAGYRDELAAERAQMEAVQEALVTELWAAVE